MSSRLHSIVFCCFTKKPSRSSKPDSQFGSGSDTSLNRNKSSGSSFYYEIGETVSDVYAEPLAKSKSNNVDDPNLIMAENKTNKLRLPISSEYLLERIGIDSTLLNDENNISKTGVENMKELLDKIDTACSNLETDILTMKTGTNSLIQENAVIKMKLVQNAINQTSKSKKFHLPSKAGLSYLVEVRTQLEVITRENYLLKLENEELRGQIEDIKKKLTNSD